MLDSRAYEPADHPLVREVKRGRDQRPAILAPGRQTWRVDLDLGAPAVLTLATALSPTSAAGPRRALPALRRGARPLVLDGPQPRQRDHLPLPGPDRTGVVEDGFKYVRTHARGNLGPLHRSLRQGDRSHEVSEELYALAADPGEQADVSAEHPDILARLRGRVLDWLAETAPGTHLRCDGPLDTKITVSSEQLLAQADPLTLETSAKVHISSTLQRVTLDLDLEEDDEDWLVLRSRRDPAGVRFEPLPEACRTWAIGDSDEEGEALDEVTEQMLREMGYIR